MKNKRYHLYAFLAAFSAGFIGLFVKLIRAEGFHFMTVSFYRLLFAAVFLAAIVPFFDKGAYKIKRKDVKGYFIVGILLAATLSAFATANYFAPVQNVSLLFNVAPFFTLIFAYFLLKEKITKTKIITLVIAIIGLIILNPFQSEGNYLLGNILAISSAVFYSLTIIGMKKERKNHGLGDVMWFFIFAALLLLPAPFIFGFGNIFNLKIFIYLIALGFMATGAQFLFYNLALKKLEAEVQTSIVAIVLPIVSILTAIIFLKEGIDFRIILGGIVLIVSGVYLEMHSKKLKNSRK